MQENNESLKNSIAQILTAMKLGEVEVGENSVTLNSDVWLSFGVSDFLKEEGLVKLRLVLPAFYSYEPDDAQKSRVLGAVNNLNAFHGPGRLFIDEDEEDGDSVWADVVLLARNNDAADTGYLRGAMAAVLNIATTLLIQLKLDEDESKFNALADMSDRLGRPDIQTFQMT